MGRDNKPAALVQAERAIDFKRPLRPEDLEVGRLFWVIRDAVVVGDAATGRIVLWNPAAERIFGYSAEEALGQTIEILVPTSSRVRHREGLAHYAATGRGALIDAGRPIELLALRKDGGQITIELSLTPIERAAVPDHLVLAIIRDVTERKQAEAERLELAKEQSARAEAEEALRIRDQFLSIAAHELRNPVTVLKAAADLLSRQGAGRSADPERQGRLLQQIAKSADRLAELTDDLLDISRIRFGQLPLRQERLDLTGFVHDVGTQYQEQLGHQHSLDVATPAALCPIQADAGRLEQVLLNLLDNAVKYSPQGGAIQLSLRPDDAGALIAVRDQGIGLPPGAAEAIFQPFGRADNAIGLPGMGLGLSICRSIVDRHRGRIWIESAGEGCGATVFVWLPCNGEAESQASLAANSLSPDR